MTITVPSPEYVAELEAKVASLRAEIAERLPAPLVLTLAATSFITNSDGPTSARFEARGSSMTITVPNEWANRRVREVRVTVEVMEEFGQRREPYGPITY